MCFIKNVGYMQSVIDLYYGHCMAIVRLVQIYGYEGLALFQQTRGIHSMLFQCWPRGEGGVPTLETALGECLVSRPM